MSKNANLHSAKRAKNDEFYTQLTDIEDELCYYWPHFKGKTILCNCDDPYESNFFKYFVLNFNKLGLKKLIATCYSGSPIAGTQLNLFDSDEAPGRVPYKAVVTKVCDATGDGAVTMDDVAELFRQGRNELTQLEGDGDFRSPESLELLDEADIVVTNPPFSLFREYIGLLEEKGKGFIVIGPQNAITYKEIFPLIKDNRLWPGFGHVKQFVQPDGTVKKFGNVCWFTNLDIKKRHEDLVLVKRYHGHESDYPRYDNYDAINVNKVKDIPEDYDGVMGVPITFLDKYCPEQFEILGVTQRNDDPYKTKRYTKEDYPNANDLNARATILVNGKPKSVYARILIRRK